MSSRASIPGNRVGSFPTTEVDRGAELAERQHVSYWCRADHETALTFAREADVPVEWICACCGAPASLVHGDARAPSPQSAFHRTPYEFLMMRRTVEEGEVILNDALDALARRRGELA